MKKWKKSNDFFFFRFCVINCLMMMWLEYKNEPSLQSRSHFCRPHLEKVVGGCQFLTMFMLNRALATVSCRFCRPHVQKMVGGWQFLTMFMLNRALATVSCTFCRPHVQKTVGGCQFLTMFMLNRALATVSSTFCRPHVQKMVSGTVLFCTKSIFMWGVGSKIHICLDSKILCLAFTLFVDIS